MVSSAQAEVALHLLAIIGVTTGDGHFFSADTEVTRALSVARIRWKRAASTHPTNPNSTKSIIFAERKIVICATVVAASYAGGLNGCLAADVKERERNF